MAENQKSIFIRFNMADKADLELYRKLSEAAGGSASLTAYVKRILEEYFTLHIKVADRQEFHNQILAAVREEIQAQGMKLVGALLARIGTVNAPLQQAGIPKKGTELPDTCEQLPEELHGILDFIA